MINVSSRHGCRAGSPRDPNLAKAVSHPLRQRILERSSAGGKASPNQLARALDATPGNVAHYVRILRRLGFIELVGARQIRVALEHHDRALAHPWLDAEQWAQLPAAFRRLTLARTLRDIVSDASDAGVSGWIRSSRCVGVDPLGRDLSARC